MLLSLHTLPLGTHSYVLLVLITYAPCCARCYRSNLKLEQFFICKINISIYGQRNSVDSGSENLHFLELKLHRIV